MITYQLFKIWFSIVYKPFELLNILPRKFHLAWPTFNYDITRTVLLLLCQRAKAKNKKTLSNLLLVIGLLIVYQDRINFDELLVKICSILTRQLLIAYIKATTQVSQC